MSAPGARDGSQRLHYLRHNGPEHILAFAPTRSGKGVGLVIPDAAGLVGIGRHLRHQG